LVKFRYGSRLVVGENLGAVSITKGNFDRNWPGEIIDSYQSEQLLNILCISFTNPSPTISFGKSQRTMEIGMSVKRKLFILALIVAAVLLVVGVVTAQDQLPPSGDGNGPPPAAQDT
jgi:hypothetical protein